MTALSKATQLLIPVAHCFQEHGGDPPTRLVVATVIEALMDQLMPPTEPVGLTASRAECLAGVVRAETRREALAIAAELRSPSK
jgi:hypothetical protein